MWSLVWVHKRLPCMAKWHLKGNRIQRKKIHASQQAHTLFWRTANVLLKSMNLLFNFIEIYARKQIYNYECCTLVLYVQTIFPHHNLHAYIEAAYAMLKIEWYSNKYTTKQATCFMGWDIRCTCACWVSIVHISAYLMSKSNRLHFLRLHMSFQ